MIVAFVTATNNYTKEIAFQKLNAVKDDTQIAVFRSGSVVNIDVKRLVKWGGAVCVCVCV